MPFDNLPEGSNHIPAAVRRAGRRADKLHAEITGSPVPPVGDPAADAPDTPAVVAAEPAAAPPPPPPEPSSVDWEQRYKTLQGKYDSEIPQLRGELDGLRQVLGSMTAPPAPAAPPRVTSTTVVDPEQLQKLTDDFGPELVEGMRLLFRAESADTIQRLEGEIATLRGGQVKIETNTVRDRTMAALDADPEIGGRWRELNNDPEFLLWADHADPFSGAKRLALLQDAFTRGDAARTGRFFKSYIAEHTAVTMPAAELPGQTPPTPVVAARPQLADLAAPGRAATPPAPGGAPLDKRIWSQPQITAFYRDRQKGVFVGREEESARLEQDIFAAAKEGRIR